MSLSEIKVAVVEDNGMARANIRNHLLDMGFTQISCFSNGRELKANMKGKQINLLLMDFHLGQNKNGVEVVQDLIKEKFISYTTCVLFITSDRMPLIIGQIVDVHPEALVIKPYTIRNLMKNIKNCLNLQRFLMPVYELMDEENFPQALVLVNHFLEQDLSPKKRTALLKLRARLLTKLGRYSESADHYRDILSRSNKVIWAKWGLIQNLFLDDKIAESQALLAELTGSELTNDKACEWLARISVDNNLYSKAEKYLQQIRDGQLSISAARLKAFILQAQNRDKEAISLLEKKRESNRSIRENYEEISLDLARCYMQKAESSSNKTRNSDLQVAKFLIGAAGRKHGDPSLNVKKDYMNALVAFLEDNPERAQEILSRPGMSQLQNAEVSTIADAVQAWRIAGDMDKAQAFLQLSQQKIKEVEEGNEKTIANIMIAQSECAMGELRPQALAFNKTGLEKFSQKDFLAATQDFYRAYCLFPREIAFSLNLLQSMVDGELLEYKKVQTLEFLNELQNRELNPSNQKRLSDIEARISKKKEVFSMLSSEPNEESMSENG
ncbi:response regulator [Paraglaciecola aestuariivivens]